MKNKQLLATSATGERDAKDVIHVVKAATAGGIAMVMMQLAANSLDVVKIRMSLDSANHNKGLFSTFRHVLASEGARPFLKGFTPIAVVSFVQGWITFGGFELGKTSIAASIGGQQSKDNRTSIYIGSAACSALLSTLIILPLENMHKRLLSNKATPRTLTLYTNLGPALLWQVPFTTAKLAVQRRVAETLYDRVQRDQGQPNLVAKLLISLSSGLVAGVVGAVASHPAEIQSYLRVQREAYGAGRGILEIGQERGYFKLATAGLGRSCSRIGILTAFQFLIFDGVIGLGGSPRD